MIEILNAEPGFHPLRDILHRPKKERPDESMEIFAARLAKMYDINRERAGETLNYLSRIEFITFTKQPFGTKKVSLLTDRGRQAAKWVEVNFAPNVLDYLEKTYPHDWLLRFLLPFRQLQERNEIKPISKEHKDAPVDVNPNEPLTDRQS